MSINLTQDEIDALNAEYCTLQASVAKRDDQLAAQGDIIGAATDADNAENKVFNFYDQDIIFAYENEREALNGTYIDSPVLLSELDDLGTLNASNRLFPSLPQTAPVRIDQFDGSPLITTRNEIPGVPSDSPATTVVDSEQYRITRQGEREDWLVNGYGGTTPPVSGTMRVIDAITPSTTQITIESTGMMETFNFQAGDTFVVVNGAQQVGVLVLNVVSQQNGDPDAGTCAGEVPPGSGTTEALCTGNGGTWTPAPTTPEAILDVAILSEGSCGANGTLDATWSGFSNADRAAKVDSTDGYTQMLLDLIDTLEVQIDARLTKLTAQQTQLGINEDTSLDPQALIDVNAAISTLNDWKVDKDVDDTELGILSSERATRNPQITARIAAIEPAKSVYYNQRYTSATNKGDTSRGTARIRIFREDTGGPGGTIETLKQQEEDRIQAIEDTLTLAGEPIPTC